MFHLDSVRNVLHNILIHLFLISNSSYDSSNGHDLKYYRQTYTYTELVSMMYITSGLPLELPVSTLSHRIRSSVTAFTSPRRLTQAAIVCYYRAVAFAGTRINGRAESFTIPLPCTPSLTECSILMSSSLMCAFNEKGKVQKSYIPICIHSASSSIVLNTCLISRLLSKLY